MQRSTLPVATTLALLLPLLGCGSGPVPQDEAVEAFATAVCDLEDRCWTMTSAQWPEGLDCRASLDDPDYGAGVLVLLDQLIHDELIAYDPEEMRRCVDAMGDVDCFDYLHGRGLPEVCGTFIEGTVEPGGACRIDVQCAEGMCGGLTCPGTCEKLPGIGEACEYWCAAGHCSGGVCAEFAELGEACEWRWDCREGGCEDGVCRLDAQLGDDCFVANDCRSGYCDRSVTGSIGTCREAPEAGIPCEFSHQCPYFASVCVLDGGAGVCRSLDTRRTAAKGEACDRSGETAPLCREGLSCVATADGATCRAPASPGEACGPSWPPVCPTGHYCAIPTAGVEGECTPLPGEGEPCVEDHTMGQTVAYCADGYRCDYVMATPACRVLVPEGAACDSDLACETFTCVDGACGFDFCEM